MKKIIKKILNGISIAISVILAVILALNLYVVIAQKAFDVQMPTVFGYANAVILSGSMEDAISVNDMVIIKQSDSYNVNDIVTYISQKGATPVTHRIISVNGDEIITKGDANNTADSPIKKENIVGKVVYVVDGVGKVFEYLSTPFGMLSLVFIGVVLIEIPNITGLLNKERKSTD